MADNESIIVEPPESEASYPDIYLIQENDEVKGGEEGVANKQAIGLTKRTQWLRVIIIQLMGMIGKLTAQSVVGNLQEGVGAMSTILGDTGANIYVERLANNTFSVSIDSSTESTGNIYVKHFTNDGVKLNSLHSVSFSSEVGKVTVLETNGTLGDYVEGEVIINLKSAEFKIRTTPDGIECNLWTRSA